MLFAYLSIASIVIFFLAFLLGDIGIYFGRLTFYLFGPILWLCCTLCFAFYYGYDVYKEEKALKPILLYLIVSANGAILLALVINDRFGAILALVIPGNIELLVSIFVVIMVPIVEEVIKAMPLLILARGFITERGKPERRIFRSPAIIALAGLISAGMFTLVETYLYIANEGNLIILNQDEAWRRNALQVLIRSLAPLHYGTVGIFVIGLTIALYNQNAKILKFKDFSIAFLGLFGAVVLHALWNGTLIFYASSNQDQVRLLLFGVLPIPNVIYGLASLGIMGVLFLVFIRGENKLCETCRNWHKPPFTIDAHAKTTIVKPSRINKLLSRNLYKCNLCKVKLGKSGDCNNCLKTDFFTCRNCLYPLPAYLSVCWNCDFKIEPLYSKVFQFRENTINSVAIGLTFVFAGVYFIQFGILLLDTIQNENSVLPLDSIFLFFMVGLVYTILSIWLLGNRWKAEAIAISRTLLAAVVFVIGSTPTVLLIATSISFFLNPLLTSFAIFILAFPLAIIFFIISCYSTVFIGFNFIPVFKGEEG